MCGLVAAALFTLCNVHLTSASDKPLIETASSELDLSPSCQSLAAQRSLWQAERRRLDQPGQLAADERRVRLRLVGCVLQWGKPERHQPAGENTIRTTVNLLENIDGVHRPP